MILSVTLTVTLLLSISFIFSSFHKYLVESSLKEKNYHVLVISNDFKKPTFVKTKLKNKDTIYLKYNNVYKTKEYTKKICQKVKCKNIVYNEKLLSLYGISGDNKLKTIKNILTTILIILGSSAFIILKNSFNINLIKRKKYLGILKSIGMTKLKIIKNQIEEGTIILLIGLLIGFITSLWAAQVLLFLVNILLKDVFQTKIILTFYPSFIIISLSFIISIFYLALIIPTFKICKQNSITLLKENTTFKKKKIPRYIYYLNPIKRLAFSNYYRLKKNYRPIKLCIFITSILYISFSLYLTYGINSINNYIDFPKYDFYIGTKGTDENYQKLKQFSKNYQKHQIYSTCTTIGNIDKKSYLNKNYNQTKIIVVKNKNEGILNYLKTKEKNKKQKYLKKEVGLNINSTINVKTINKIPFALDEFLTKDNIVFLTNNFDKYCSNYTLNLYIKDKKNIIKKLPKLKIKDEIIYTDVKKSTKITKNFIFAFKIALYGILTIVIVISISLINSSFSLIIYQREKELGILKSIGITNLNLKKLLLIESLLILFTSFIFIVPISYLISYILYQGINKTVMTNLFVPKKEILFSFIVTLIIIYNSLVSNYNKIKRKSIIEMINKENV